MENGPFLIRFSWFISPALRTAVNTRITRKKLTDRLSRKNIRIFFPIASKSRSLHVPYSWSPERKFTNFPKYGNPSVFDRRRTPINVTATIIQYGFGFFYRFIFVFLAQATEPPRRRLKLFEDGVTCNRIDMTRSPCVLNVACSYCLIYYRRACLLS